jgi:hypothetical protein
MSGTLFDKIMLEIKSHDLPLDQEELEALAEGITIVALVHSFETAANDHWESE